MKGYSTTYIATFVVILAQVLPLMGIDVGTEALTTTAQTIATVLAGLWVLVERYKRGDVSLGGFRV